MAKKAEKRKFKNGEQVEARSCLGTARIVSFIRGFEVYLLDTPLSRKFVGKESDGEIVACYVPYWTFEESQLIARLVE